MTPEPLTVEACCAQAQTIVSEASERWPQSTLCCAFDIDDTLLLVDANGYLVPHKPVVRLLKWCFSKGLRVHVITARPNSSRRATMRDLRDIGVMDYIHTLQMLPPNYGVAEVALWKFVARWHMLLIDREVKGQSHMVFTMGDQWWDVVGTDAFIEAAEHMCPLEDAAYVVAQVPRAEAAMTCIKLPER